MDEHGRIIRRDKFKGFTPAQRRRIMQDNEMILLAKREKDEQDRRGEQMWARQQMMVERAMEDVSGSSWEVLLFLFHLCCLKLLTLSHFQLLSIPRPISKSSLSNIKRKRITWGSSGSRQRRRRKPSCGTRWSSERAQIGRGFTTASGSLAARQMR